MNNEHYDAYRNMVNIAMYVCLAMGSQLKTFSHALGGGGGGGSIIVWRLGGFLGGGGGGGGRELLINGQYTLF